VLSSVAQLVIYGRLLYVGLTRRSVAVTAGLSERPTWPDALAPRQRVGLSRAERAFERGGHAVNGALDVIWSVPAAIRANRALLAGGLALAVALLALTVAAGGFGVVEASRAVPGPGGPGPVEGPGAPSEAPGSEAPASESASSPPPASQTPASGAPVSGAPASGGSQPSGSPIIQNVPSSGGPSFQPIPS